MFDRAIAITAEDRIAAAYARGEFDHNPHFGRKHDIIDGEYDPNWWLRAKLRRESLPRLMAESPSVPKSGNAPS